MLYHLGESERYNYTDKTKTRLPLDMDETLQLHEVASGVSILFPLDRVCESNVPHHCHADQPDILVEPNRCNCCNQKASSSYIMLIHHFSLALFPPARLTTSNRRSNGPSMPRLTGSPPHQEILGFDGESYSEERRSHESCLRVLTYRVDQLSLKEFGDYLQSTR